MNGLQTQPVAENATSAVEPDKVQHAFLLAEHAALRTEIIERLSKQHRLTALLYSGAIIYLTTLFAPLDKLPALNSGQISIGNLLPIAMLYISLVIILPLIGLSIEILSESESDAISRCGVYLRDQIERKINTSGYRGWEDWLDRQNKSSRRRISERLAKYARISMLIIYSGASSLIAGHFVSEISGIYGINNILVFYHF